jgi:hypothetical protein
MAHRADAIFENVADELSVDISGDRVGDGDGHGRGADVAGIVAVAIAAEREAQTGHDHNGAKPTMKASPSPIALSTS